MLPPRARDCMLHQFMIDMTLALYARISLPRAAAQQQRQQQQQQEQLYQSHITNKNKGV